MVFDNSLHKAVQAWIDQDPDTATREEAQTLLHQAESDDDAAIKQLSAAFSDRVRFGTAGLRAPLGAGPARMNRVVVAQATAGFAAFLLQRATRGETSSPPSIIIGYDARNNSEVFARDTAEIMAGAGISVTLAPHPVPTPITAFAVRHLGCSAGVMITASHNPAGENGYKVYLGDADGGSQITSPTDAQISACIDEAATQPCNSYPRSSNYTLAQPQLLEDYLSHAAEAVRAGLPDRAADRRPTPPVPLRIVYTAMHGVGAELTRELFARVGLPRFVSVPEQHQPDGGFPTLPYPNPEEPNTLDLAYRTAREIDAEVVIAQDPDADRLAIALPDPDAEHGYRRLTGNELGLLLGWRAAERESRRANEAGEHPRGTLANTFVSSPALSAVAQAYGLDHAETPSGSKWLSRVPHLLFGFEEALGYLTHPEVLHDKDGVLAAAEATAMLREFKAQGCTAWQMLDEASMRFGHFTSSQILIRRSTASEVQALAAQARTDPPLKLGDIRVTALRDSPHALCFDLEGGGRVMLRPSGTEPKLKVYIDVCCERGSLGERRAAAAHTIETIEAATRDYLDLITQQAGFNNARG